MSSGKPAFKLLFLNGVEFRAEAFLSSEVDVMISIFVDFRPFSAKILAFF
jgi:hypothetical protein